MKRTGKRRLTDSIKPMRLRGTTSDRSVSLAIKDKNGRVLFDISDDKSYIALEIISVENNYGLIRDTAHGKFTALLVGHKKEVYLNIQEGEFFLKI